MEELSHCCKVTAETMGTPGKPVRWVVFVEERLLWSPEGLAHLFDICRSGWLSDPKNYPDDLKAQNTWDGFHILSIEQADGFVQGDGWEEPDEPEPARCTENS
jgi:hypothetical protein